MDPSVLAAGRALAAGDPLAALKRVALRDDAPALALRGIAMAQLGDLDRAGELLDRAVRGFAASDRVARARCTVARAEVALASRALGSGDRDRALDAAAAILAAHGDRTNALHAQLIAIRRWLVLGRIAQAADALAGIAPGAAPPHLVAIAQLLAADVAIRQVRAADARAALAGARAAAVKAGIPALIAEVARAAEALDRPAARIIASGEARLASLAEIEAVLASRDLVVDACRRCVRDGRGAVSLATRPVLFSLVRALAAAWPGDVAREALIAEGFGLGPGARVSDSHRARLRVDLGRVRRALGELAAIAATPRGFALAPRRVRRVIVLAPPIDGQGGALLALLADGEAWSTAALALALGQSQRTVQRALVELEAQAKVVARGGARARRWLAQPITAVTMALLLPATVAM